MTLQEPAVGPSARSEPDGDKAGSAEQTHPIDKWVFGISAALVLVFIAWGMLATDTLSAVAKAVLGGVVDGGGWAFVLAASGFVVFALWLAFSRYGKIPLGQDGEEPGVPHVVVGRDDVQRRHGHRADVLRRRRAAVALHLTAAGHRRDGFDRGARRRDGHDAVPLDAAPVGDLRGGRPGDRVPHVPPRSPAADQLGVHPAARPARAPRARSAGPSTSWPSSRRCSAPPLRWASVRCRSAAGLAATASGSAGGTLLLVLIIAVLTVAFVASAVTGVAQGHPVAVQHQHGARARSSPSSCSSSDRRS